MLLLGNVRAIAAGLCPGGLLTGRAFDRVGLCHSNFDGGYSNVILYNIMSYIGRGA